MMHPSTPQPFIHLAPPLSPFSLKLVSGRRNVTIGQRSFGGTMFLVRSPSEGLFNMLLFFSLGDRALK